MNLLQWMDDDIEALIKARSRTNPEVKFQMELDETLSWCCFLVNLIWLVGIQQAASVKIIPILRDFFAADADAASLRAHDPETSIR